MFGSRDKIVDGVTYSGSSGLPKAFSGFEYHKGQGWKTNKGKQTMTPGQGAFAKISNPLPEFIPTAFAWFGPVGTSTPRMTPYMIQHAIMNGPIHLYKLVEDAKAFKWEEMKIHEENRQQIEQPQFILVTTQAEDRTGRVDDWIPAKKEWRYYGPDATDGGAYPANTILPDLKTHPWPITKKNGTTWTEIQLRNEDKSTAAQNTSLAANAARVRDAEALVRASNSATALKKLEAEKDTLELRLKEVKAAIIPLSLEVNKAMLHAHTPTAGGRRSRKHKHNLKRRRPSTLKRSRR